tara:strand:+ start:363 stop:1370 length:1008 start_codon:yes stop_codon:yes gene_type:complete
MKLNAVEVIDRHNRPPVLQRVLLRTFFINDGDFVDPYAISAVHIFKKSAHTSPSTVLNTDNLVASTVSAAMVFGASGTGVVATDTSFQEVNYNGVAATSNGDVALGGACSSVSGIYKISKGEFAVVLDGLLGSSLSGVAKTQDTTIVTNTASAPTDYIDVWTVKLTQNSSWKTYINTFSLYDDTLFTITEPLLFKTRNKLVNKHITLGSKVNLKVATETTIENSNVTQEVKNIFKDSVITSAMMKIEKFNDNNPILPSKYELSGYSDTSSLIDITSDNTIVLNWDTEVIKNLTANATEKLKRENIGSPAGAYLVTVKYNILNQTIVSPPFTVILS